MCTGERFMGGTITQACRGKLCLHFTSMGRRANRSVQAAAWKASWDGRMLVGKHLYLSSALPALCACMCLWLQEFWPKLTGLKWIHSGAVGLEHLLTQELVDSPVVVTNARGVYSQSLAE